MFTVSLAALVAGRTGDSGPGDAQAERLLDEAFRDHHRWAVRLATQLTGDPQAAEDVVADVYVGLFKRLQRAPVDDVRAYLRRSIVNRRNSFFRRVFVERAHAGVRSGDGRGAIDHATESAERQAMLHALDRLSPKLRAVIVLRFYEDLSVDDTASVLGVAPGTVKAATHRGLAKLRSALEDPS